LFKGYAAFLRLLNPIKPISPIPNNKIDAGAGSAGKGSASDFLGLDIPKAG